MAHRGAAAATFFGIGASIKGLDGAARQVGMRDHLQPIILVGYDSGMRLREVLGLRWSQVDLKLGMIKLSAEDTKTEEPRTVFLTSRAREALEAQPRHIKCDGYSPIRRQRRRGRMFARCFAGHARRRSSRASGSMT